MALSGDGGTEPEPYLNPFQIKKSQFIHPRVIRKLEREVEMEKIGEDLQSEKLKSQTAIRCAKAAILLSSLKNATKNSLTDLPQLQDDEMIGKLMFQLVKEKQKRKKLSQLIGISLIFLFIVLLIYPIFLISL